MHMIRGYAFREGTKETDNTCLVMETSSGSAVTAPL